MKSGRRAARIRAMFDRLARRYDLVNDVISIGQHRRWRRVAARMAESGGRVLDLATGTGDFALELARSGDMRVVGVDFSSTMLGLAQAKLGRSLQRLRVGLVQADALALPFQESAFDGVTSAFLLRNLVDLEAGLAEMHRVLKPGGWVVALDITRPKRGLVGAAVRWYLRATVPLMGGLLTGEWSAYRYLPASVEPLPDAERLSELFRAVGFSDVSFVRLGLGSIAIHRGRV